MIPPSFGFWGEMQAKKVIVIGAGAAGMLAAGRAAECGASVLLLEKTPRVGNKLRLTGKGRCNLTNEATLDEFVVHFGSTGRFLYGPFSRFFVQDLISFFGQLGVPTSVERGGRVFPVSNDASQVVDALSRYLERNRVEICTRAPVERLLKEGDCITGVQVRGHTIATDYAILATGGVSYPRTGSTGDGYRLAADVGHRIIPIRPALVPLVTKEHWPSLQGLSLRNVRATLLLDDKPIAQEFGKMLFTHFGVSGPIVLTLSKRAVDALPRGRVSLSIDLKPALRPDELDDWLRDDLAEHGKQQLSNVLTALVPARMADVFAMLVGVPHDKPAHQITGAERKRLRNLLQDLRLVITGARPIDEAVVTAGGVDTAEIDPRSMESRLVHGLYLCGEVIDVDADTGGYNLQAAFSTGYVAGESAARLAVQRGS